MANKGVFELTFVVWVLGLAENTVARGIKK